MKVCCDSLHSSRSVINSKIDGVDARADVADVGVGMKRSEPQRGDRFWVALQERTRSPPGKRGPNAKMEQME